MVDGVDVVLDDVRVPEAEPGKELLLDGGVEAPEDDGLVTQGSDSLNILTFS